MTSIFQIVNQMGPCTTIHLAKELVKRHKLTSSAARKRIQRAREKKEVYTANFSLAHNQQFVYLPKHLRTKLLRERLFAALSDTNSVLRFPVAGLRARGGLIPKNLFATYSGLPIKNSNITALKAQSDLAQLGILKTTETQLRLDPMFLNMPLEEKRLNGRLAKEQTMLCAFIDWLRLQGIIHHQMTVRGAWEPPQFGYYQWDFVAPSYAYPLATGTGNKKQQGYIVADIIMGRVLDSQDVQYFLHKCKSIRYSKKMPNFLAWLIADRFEIDVLHLAQTNGIVCTTPGNLFNKQLAKLLDQMSQLIEGKEFASEHIEDVIVNLVKQLSELEHLKSLNGNLRGVLFEVMVGHWLVRKYGGTVRFGLPVRGKDNDYDSEVLLNKPGSELRCIECKNRRKVTLEDVEHWYGYVVPAIRHEYNVRDNYPLQEFSIWTTGKFEEPALNRLKALQADCKKFEVTFAQGELVEQNIRQLHDPRLTQAYKSWLAPFLDLF